MSQDLMQTLSGSSLLSLSVGTLPAVKQGMNLDANPFASQLALMTGADAAEAGAFVPVTPAPAVGEGAFARALGDMSVPAAPDVALRAPVASDGTMAAPIADVAKPAPAAAAPKIIAALPEDASTSQIIEAALTGAASIEAPVVTTPGADTALVADKAPAPQVPTSHDADPQPAAPHIAAQPAAAPHVAAQLAAGAHAIAPHNVAQPVAAQPAQVPQVAAPHRTAPQASVPLAPVSDAAAQPAPIPQVNAVAAVSRVPTQVAVRPVEAVDAPMPAPAALTPEPALEPEEPVAGEIDTTKGDAPRPHRRARGDAPVVVADAAPAVALPPIPATQPVAPVDAPVTDLGTTRIADKAALQAPRQTAETDAVLAAERPAAMPAALADTSAETPAATEPAAQQQRMSDAADPLATNAAAITPPVEAAIPAQAPAPAVSAATPAAPIAQDSRAPTSPAVGAASAAAPRARPAATKAAPVTSAPRSPVSAPTTLVQPAPATEAAAPVASAPIATAPVSVVPAAPVPDAPVQPHTDRSASENVVARAPITRAAPNASAAQQTVAQPVAAAPAVPAAAASPANDTARVANDIPGALAAEPAAVAAAAAQPMPAPQVQAQQGVQQVQATPGARTGVVAPRMAFSAAARRTIDSAAQSQRPAEALSTLFKPTEMDIDPAAAMTRAESVAVSSLGAVPPPWAMALNAVNSPAQAIPGITMPLESSNAAAAPVETMAFDSGFVTNIESQVARVVNGGEMVRIQIIPENMGRIDIEMLAGPERDQVRIVTEHDAVRDTLVSSQHRLEQDLRSNAQRPTEVTVELRQQSPGTQNGSAQQQQQRGQSGAEAVLAREAAQRQTAADAAADATPAERRPRGNIRYA